MLREIYCEHFISKGKPRGRITFDDGLNVVRGHDSGKNSIGKSSFLLAIDFAFGGGAYARDKTITAKIGHHNIYFCFIFNEDHYYFARNTEDTKVVVKCDSNYNLTGETLSISKYHLWLFSMYKIPLKNISFRDIVGRYFRIYGKQNTSEVMPLAVTSGEAQEKSLTALIKLYNGYAPISQVEIERDALKKTKEAIAKAGRQNLIRIITRKKTFEKNQNQIEKLQAELYNLKETGAVEYLTADPKHAEMIAEYKSRFDLLNKYKRKLWSQYYAIKNSVEVRRPASEQDFKELLRYFPNANIKSMTEIENFHTQLSVILNEESDNFMCVLITGINNTARDLTAVENAMKSIKLPEHISSETINACVNVSKQIDTLQNENDLYLKNRKVIADLKEIQQKYTMVFMAQMTILQKFINSKMAVINKFIWGKDTFAPTIQVSAPNSYELETYMDTGTGKRYGNLLMFDIVALEETPLPALVHDTVLFKQIEQEAMSRFIELYNKRQKQVFISIDETTKYSDKAIAIVSERTKLTLSKGDELFGSYWGGKDNN